MPKHTPAEVLAELTGDNRTVDEAATHVALIAQPCACRSTEDHDYGQEYTR